MEPQLKALAVMPNSIVIPVGTRVVFKQDLNLEPYTTVEAGEVGVVVPSQREDFVDIRLDKVHPMLNEHQNTAWLCRTYDIVTDYIMPCDAAIRQWRELLDKQTVISTTGNQGDLTCLSSVRRTSEPLKH